MYCGKCGNKLGDKDQFCRVCGAPTGYREPSAAPAGSAEIAEINEEIIFNPPYGNPSHFSRNELRFAEEESSGPENGEENEIEKQKNETEETDINEKIATGGTRTTKDNEFIWNIHEFPKAAAPQTEDIEFNWNMDEYSLQEEKAAKAATFEEELFQEMEDDTRRIREKNIDRFFTFSRKNEEFQKLLDKEYEKFRTRSRSMAGQFTGEAVPEAERGAEAEAEKEAAPDAEKETDLHKTEAQPAAVESEPAAAEMEPAESEPSAESEPDTARVEAAGAESAAAAAGIEPTTEAAEIEPATEAESAAGTVPEPTVEESASEAEESPFPAALESPVEAEKTPEEESEAAPDYIGEQAREDQPESIEEPEAPESEALSQLLTLTHREYDGQGDLESRVAEAFAVTEGENEGKPKRNVWQVLLVIIAVLLVIEIAILGIRYFAPDSVAAGTVNTAQTKVIQTVSGWVNGIKELFSGKDSDEGAITQDNGDQETGNVGNVGKDEPKSGEGAGSGTGSESEAASKPVVEPPDPNPTADKNVLVTSQLGNNTNIQQVKANDALAWQQGKNYGIADLNNSKPIENNVWQTPENGEPVYFDQSVVGTVIAFDSQWIDYVNSGNKNVLELLKKDSEAYRKTANFSRIGKIKETFKLLEIGEIRQGADGFYVWAHEEIQVTENGKATDKKFNWIYYLEPQDGKMKIVNYYRF